MKRSLKTQLVLLFLSLTAIVFAGVVLANTLFLGKYYISSTQKHLIQVYEQLEQAIQQNELEDDNFQMEMQRDAEASNLALIVLYKGKEYSFSDLQSTEFMKGRLFRYNIDIESADDFREPDNLPARKGEPHEEIKILKETGDYTIAHCIDGKMGTTYMEMWGTLPDNGLFALRTPIESITRSAAVANRFLFIISLAAMLLGVAILLAMLNRFTAPVEELTALSEKMANLDFEARYTGGGSAEIAVLGDNFNRMSASLESAIKDLKNANLTLQKDIELKDKREERRKEFLTNVSHEMKTPLAVIEGYGEGLQSELGESEEKRIQYTQIIIDETTKMNHMLQNLLSLSELEAGDPQMQRFEITELIHEVVSSVSIQASQENIEIECDLPARLVVWGDPAGVEQVFTNYLSNAIRYAVGENRLIKVYIQLHDDKARFCVYNTGEQISQENMARIWEKFYKIDKVRSRSKGGTGIGLSIVKAVMDQHGQAYGVQNEPYGVTFWFELNCN